MSIIYTLLPRSECQRLSARDSSYLKQQLSEHSALNRLLGKKINRQLLSELRCVLDRKPIARRKAEQKNSKVYVYKDGKLIRIEHGSGRVMKMIEET